MGDASLEQQHRQAEEVVPALWHHVDPTVEGGATGRNHVVQRVQHVLQARSPNAGILAEGEPYVQLVEHSYKQREVLKIHKKQDHLAPLMVFKLIRTRKHRKGKGKGKGNNSLHKFARSARARRHDTIVLLPYCTRWGATRMNLLLVPIVG